MARDGFTGFKTATAEEIPQAVAVMDPFHVVALAGDALDRCLQRVQQATCGHRGRSGNPLYGICRVLRAGADLLTSRQCDRLNSVFAADEHEHQSIPPYLTAEYDALGDELRVAVAERLGVNTETDLYSRLVASATVAVLLSAQRVWVAEPDSGPERLVGLLREAFEVLGVGLPAPEMA